MTREINFLLLNKPELEYEVKIRLEVPEGTLVNLKKQILNLSTILPSEEIVSSVLSIEEDVNELDVTLEYINDKIGDSEFSKFLFKRITSYINHCYYRVSRIDSHTTKDQLILDKFNSVKHKFYKLDDKIKCLLNSNEESTPTTLAITESSTTTPLSVKQIPFKSLIEIKKFSFNGKTCPRAFLIKVNEFSVSRHIEKNELINHAYEIFTDEALHWFRFQKDNNPTLTWDELSNLLIRDFGEIDFDFKLLATIRNRTQGEKESIAVYISIMHGMFQRLTEKLCENEQINILLRNIRPCYSTFIANSEIKSTNNLLLACQKYEYCIEKSSTFIEPTSSPYRFAAEFNYRGQPSSFNRPASSCQPSTSSQPPSGKQLNNTKIGNFYKPPMPWKGQQYPYVNVASYNLFCLRCRINGHCLQTCRKPRTLVCFKCGLKDFKASNCPNCVKNDSSEPSSKN